MVVERPAGDLLPFVDGMMARSEAKAGYHALRVRA
jgi:hypothetical protein